MFVASFVKTFLTGSKIEMSGGEHSHIHKVVTPKACILPFAGITLN
jgi:hypothetical protein